MRFLRRAVPGLGLGLLFGCLDAARVVHRLHVISLQNLSILVFYALFGHILLFSIISLLIPHRLTNPLRSRNSKIVVGVGTVIVAVFLGMNVRLPAHPSIGSDSSSDKPSIVLISVDTLRRDHLGCYGYAKARTPSIDNLAKESVLFEDATSPIPLTGPSHVTMLTGDYPITHGVGANGVRIGETVKTVPEILREMGYRTAAFVSGWTLKDESVGLSNRFGTYKDEFGLSPLLPDF